ncbi:uncharacterized protein H6S33_000022 [Morchella sextelata]|uniref:uncharacterized protein n=1 Tax=Morchella sextelata TaxID=1174677 RepID=UPI001D049A04|nr:uncharacterized protein H6S33_000022 [Morchella sextelata]KAH0614386.1 hypothetical protein H6S33_000022 [Morchella sextelata]
MVVLRNRSLSTTATRSSTPPARAPGRKSTRVNISKQDGSDDEILECIVVRSSLPSQLITSKSERLNRVGVHKSVKSTSSFKSASLNTPVSRSSSPSVRETHTDSDVEESLMALHGSSRKKAVKRKYITQSTPDHNLSGPETPQSIAQALPESPPSSIFDSSSEQLSAPILKPCKAPWNVPAFSESYKSLASPLSLEHRQVLNNNHVVDEVSYIPTSRRHFTRKLSAPMISLSNSARPVSSNANQQSRKCMGRVQQHSDRVVVPKDKSPTQDAFRKDSISSGMNTSIIVTDLVQGSNATELLPAPSRRPLSNTGGITAPSSTRFLRERRNVTHRSLEVSAKKARRSKKVVFQNSGSDEILESIFLKPLTASIHKETGCKQQSTDTQTPATSTVSPQPLDPEQGYQLSKPDIFASVLPTAVLSKSGPELSHDPQLCSEKDESDAYVETLLLMSGLSPEAVNDMMSQRQTHRVVC